MISATRSSQKANDQNSSDLLALPRHSTGDYYDSYVILATSTPNLARIEPPPSGGRSMASAASVAPTSSHAS